MVQNQRRNSPTSKALSSGVLCVQDRYRALLGYVQPATIFRTFGGKPHTRAAMPNRLCGSASNERPPGITYQCGIYRCSEMA